MQPRMPRSAGFTLIEVMITVAILSIVAAIAIPIYRDYVIRGTIPEATSRLSEMRTRMEQYFLDNRAYDCAAIQPTLAAQDPTRDQYTLTCAVQNAADGSPGYRVTATGNSNKPSYGFTYDIDQAGTQRTTALPASWASGVTLPVNRWVTTKGG